MKDFIKKLAANDVINRAFHTAWQVALVVWAGTEFSLDSAALAAVGGAVLSALKTLVVNQYGGRASIIEQPKRARVGRTPK